MLPTKTNVSIASKWHAILPLCIYILAGIAICFVTYSLSHLRTSGGMRNFGEFWLYFSAGYVFVLPLALFLCVFSAVWNRVWTSYVSLFLISLASLLFSLFGVALVEEFVAQAYNQEHQITISSIVKQFSRELGRLTPSTIAYLLLCILPAILTLFAANKFVAKQFGTGAE